MRYGQITCMKCGYTYSGVESCAVTENGAAKCAFLGCEGVVTFKPRNGSGQGYYCTACGHSTFGAKPDQCKFHGCGSTDFVLTSLAEHFQKSAAPS